MYSSFLLEQKYKNDFNKSPNKSLGKAVFVNPSYIIIHLWPGSGSAETETDSCRGRRLC